MAIASVAGLADALDDRALFDAAIAPDPEPQQPAGITPPQPSPAAEVTPPQTTVEEATPSGVEATPEGDLVPSWRLREEREAREAYAGRLMERERQLTEALNYLRQMQAQAAPPAPPVDPVADLAGFHREQANAIAQMRAEFNNQMRTNQLESNLQLTRMQYGDELFDAAYRAFVEVGSNDQAFARAIVGAANPGASMVNWFTQARTLAEIGPDPDAWFNQRKAALLQDPEFLQQAVEAARNYQPPARDAQGRFTERQAASSNVTVLPPSLMRMRGASSSEATAATPGGDDPLSDNSLFAFATQKR